MVAHVNTVAFHGIEARAVDVQVHISAGLPAFTKVYGQYPAYRASALKSSQTI